MDRLECTLSMRYNVFFSQPPPEMIRRIKKLPPSQMSQPKKRVGGPGVYQVVQCGTAGHNLRAKPNMKGTPVGRLSKRSSIEAAEEVNHSHVYAVFILYVKMQLLAYVV